MTSLIALGPPSEATAFWPPRQSLTSVNLLSENDIVAPEVIFQFTTQSAHGCRICWPHQEQAT